MGALLESHPHPLAKTVTTATATTRAMRDSAFIRTSGTLLYQGTCRALPGRLHAHFGEYARMGSRASGAGLTAPA
jgi:hypothetical protein